MSESAMNDGHATKTGGVALKWTVGRKIGAFMAGFLLVLIVVSGYSLFALHKIGFEVEEIGGADLEITHQFMAMTIDDAMQQLAMARILAAANTAPGVREEALQQATEHFEARTHTLNTALHELEDAIQDAIEESREESAEEAEEAEEEFGELLVLLAEFRAEHDRVAQDASDIVADLRNREAGSAAVNIPARLADSAQRLERLTTRLLDFFGEFTQDSVEQAASIQTGAVRTIAFLGLFGVLGGVASTLLVSRMLTAPLAKLATQARRLTHEAATGCPQVARVNVASSDEIGELALDFNRMADSVTHHMTLLGRSRRELRIARDLAESASEAKSQFLANMSHEIRTPMSGVMGMTELLCRTQLTDRQRRFAETAHRSATALLTIINDILDISKIEAGMLMLEQIDFDLHREIEGAVALFSHKAYEKGLELLYHIPDDTKTLVRGDPGRLRQILVNFLSNSVKFTETGEVALRVSTMTADDGARVHRFEVRDTGIGMDPDTLKAVFQPFVQADGSVTRKYGGTGLGLAIARELAELMGGEVGADSEVGHGSTFWFTARLDEQPARTQPLRTLDLELPSLHVLIVDDNRSSREILQEQLNSWGIRTLAADRREAALESLRSAAAEGRPFDVALLDSDLQGTSGVQLAREVKQLPQGADVRLIVMAPEFGLAQLDAASCEDLVGQLPKPVSPSALFNSIVKAMGLAGSRPATGQHRQTEASTEPLEGMVLLVDDNPVNQEVALGSLEYLGCRVRIASSGREAIEAVEQDRFDAVLMDVEMPEMDGLEATRRIRRMEDREATSQGEECPRTPIIALTAHAKSEDRERCLAAGMSDFMSKPFSTDQLTRVLSKWLQPRDCRGETEMGQERTEDDAPTPKACRSAGQSTPRINFAALESIRSLQRDGSPDILGRVIRAFCSDTPEMINGLREAAGKADAEAVRQAAHRLKSSCANVGADDLAERFREIEEMGRSGAVNVVAMDLEEVEVQCCEVQSLLQETFLVGAS